ncbi:histidine--tRNA ligase [Labrys miyagiensis]|uniref:Histidine--tRNA ligase n=1 Tax=Labrys miyagiensis TaxID=346912 RepID=A0ABQ6CA04_9HYPH|nr:histidine--tRNA ligase [Labrys miyagiensis]GLS17128.1 histidine--tRNA ligase [Labrys miyagiensis]
MAGDKKQKLKARQARGFVDRSASEIMATRAMVATIQSVYELYGFEPGETPFVEYSDALGKFLPDQDRPNEGVFSFQDDDEQWLSLRYDLTAPLARYVAENFDALPKPYRSYRSGFVFRNEKPGPGRFRQFMQFDADTVGSPSVAADAEICMMAADTMEKLGIARGSYLVRINNRKVLDGIMEAIGLSGDENAGRRLTVLRAIDKFDRLGAEGVRDLLSGGRKDESGDFTKGAGLEPAQAQTILDYVTGQRGSNAETLERIRPLVASSVTGSAGVEELARIADLVGKSGYGPDRIVIDTSIVRGLEYYTGPVYEVELTFEVKDEQGRPVRFGSVAGGGRYDGLVARFRGEPVPAAGFSIGVSRLLAALTALGRVDSAGEKGPVVVCVMDQARLADYQAMASELRQAGIRAEVYLGGSGMKAQLKYADRRKSPVAVIQGSDEAEKGEVQLKDLALGAEMAKAIADNAEWREARVAQRVVPRSELVKTVKEMLG